MKRDWRLLTSFPLFVGSAILAVLHSNRLAWWSMAWGGHDEETMQNEFGVIPPANCSYDCYSWGAYPGDYFALPALTLFAVALGLIAWAWWKPKS